MRTLPTNENSYRLRGLLGGVGLLFAILFLRLFHLQITTFDDYARESEQNRISQKRVQAARGLILARDGEVLAHNRAAYSILLNRSSPQRDSLAIAALQLAIGDSIGPVRRQRVMRLRRDVDFAAVSIVEERLNQDWNLEIAKEPQRNYPYKELAAHVLGYMGELRESDLQKPQAKKYFTGDLAGKTGIEKKFEPMLRGEDGVRFIKVDARHRNLGELEDREQPAVTGEDIHLTLDLRTQMAAQEALPDSMAGSIVAIDPRNGEVLAMVSNPSFDPNVFVSFHGQKERRRLMQGGTNLFNRAIRGRYSPGSTLKMLAAVAALEAGITDTLLTFEACKGWLQVGDDVFRCIKRDGHGELNLLEATERSCNIYFLHLALTLGMPSWREYAAKFGFGQLTDINLDGESPGFLPTQAYYQEKEGWVLGHLMNLVIGQGAILTTPLQMARFAAALGNGGYLVTPHITGPSPPPRRIEGITDHTLDIVRRSMHRVVYGNHGTGYKLKIDNLEVAGKSGTAQAPNRDDDAWFIAFAPYARPEIAVAVMVEGGGFGGSVAGPIARQVIEAHFTDRLLAAKGKNNPPTATEQSLLSPPTRGIGQ